jgi:ribonuclease P/MRP protein subunit RPP40
VADKIRIFLTGNKLICPQQHGFMSSRSTTTNLLSCDAVIARHLNNGSSCDVILLDFARAFDKVPHDILSRKLLNIGIKGKLHEWLMNFLSGRSQYVSYQSVSSSPVPVTSGVIQGSVLGPLLFTIFINDLPSAISTVSMWLFADDAKLVGEASTDEQCVAIQCDLEAIHEWSVRNKLFLCLPKNQCLHIGKKNRRKSYLISGTSLSVVDKCIDLGIVRNSSFTYDDHIASVISKASRAAGMIYRAFSIRSMAFLVKLFNTYVLPIVEYASPVWSPAGVGLIDDVERVLRRYTKRLPLLRDCSYGERLQRLNMVTLQDRRRKADLMIAYKILHGHYDIPPDSVGISLSKLDTRGGGSNLTVHRASSTKISRSFYYRIASEWNAMPIAAKQSKSIWTFARKL